jgi:hypothetical protein
MITFRTTAQVTALAFTLALFAAGPLSADEPAPAISGTIKFQGSPLEVGKIVFHLNDGEFVGGKVKDGIYKLTRVPPGTWRVSIEGTGAPARYGSEEKTTLKVDVKAGANIFDFDLR